MNSKIFFILGCIPTRLLLSLLLLKIDKKYLPYLSIPLFLIGLSFIYLYFSKSRLNAFEAGGETWWKNWRPIHGLLYITAGILCLKQNRFSSLVILLDTILGLSLFVHHHYF